MDLAAVVAGNVRGHRARLQLRQKDLAERIGWTVTIVSDLETGSRRIGVEDLPRLCDGLGISLRQLLDGADAEDLAKLRL